MKYSIKLKNYHKWIFFLFPFLLISGPFFPDLIISCVSIFFLIKVVKNNEYYLLRNNIFYFLISFYLYLNINSLFSHQPYISFETSIPYIRFILFAFFLSYCLNLNFNLKKIIIISFSSSYIILLLDSLLQLITGKNLLGYSIVNDRISSFFGDHLIMGSFVSRTLPLVIGLLFLENCKYRFFLQSSIFVICGILVFLSAERLSFAYFLITFSLFIFFTLRKKNIFYVVSILIVFFLFLHLAKPSSSFRLITHTVNQISEKNKFSIFSYRHELHYVTAYNIFKENFFFGGGLKSFRFLCDKDQIVPLNKILLDNILNSPIDGFFYIKKNHNSHSLIISKIPLVIDNQILNFNNVDLFHYLIGGEKNLLKFYKENGDFVYKGQPLVSAYDYHNGCNTHPHNVLMQFLSELGIFGIIFYFIVLFFLIKKLLFIIIKKITNKSLIDKEYLNFFILLGLLLSLFPLFPSGNFFNNWLSAIFYLYVGLLINTLKKHIKS
jgi:O-antigen ligase